MLSSRRRFLVFTIFALAALSGLMTTLVLADALASTAPAEANAPSPRIPTLSIFAAASLQDVLKDLSADWRSETGGGLEFNFGASNDLARQIEAAPRADIFFSADESLMDRLAGPGLIDAGSRRSLISNRLVVIAPADSELTVAEASSLAAPGVRRLALANTESVPAGKYAKAWLEGAGVWDLVKDRVIPTLDVRACLATVESGNVEAGVVYRTDAMTSRKVRILYEVPESEGPAISYPVAAIANRPHLDTARRFAAWLASDRAGETFRRHGFLTRGTAARP